jgi:hypothetical protein
MKRTHLEINLLTGEETITEREETAEEKKSREKAAAHTATAIAEAEAKETAKAAILDRIGLTADELKTILG